MKLKKIAIAVATTTTFAAPAVSAPSAKVKKLMIELIDALNVGNEKALLPYANSSVRVQNERCAEDQIKTLNDAHKRNMWAAQCGFIPKKIGTNFTVRHLYTEEAPSDLSDPFSTPVLKDRARPLYPVFVDSKNGNKVWKPNYSTCDHPEGLKIGAFCVTGCFAPEQTLAFEEGEIEIAKAEVDHLNMIYTLNPSSTFDSLSMDLLPVEYVVSFREQDEKILTLTMESGRLLKVTPGHPILNGQGWLLPAKDFSIGDQLVRSDGSMDAVLDLEEEMRFTKVYNVKVPSFDTLQNIVFADGYLVGTNGLQTGDVKGLNQVIMRESTPDSLVEVY